MANPTPDTSAITQRGAFPRDDNFIPVTQNGLQTSITVNLTGNNTTTAVPLFTVTGSIQVIALYGIVTTALGANITACYWRLNDQTSQVDISLATGVTASAVVAGSAMWRRSTASAAAVVDNASAGRVRDPTGANLSTLTPTLLTAKNGALTQVEFVYTTTDTPTTGTIQFFIGWIPMSAGGKVVPTS